MANLLFSGTFAGKTLSTQGIEGRQKLENLKATSLSGGAVGLALGLSDLGSIDISSKITSLLTKTAWLAG